VVVPAYCRSREGGVYRVVRSSALVAPDRVRYALRAVPVKQDGNPGHEVACEFDTSLVREKIALRQTIPTSEDMFGSLWQQLRVDLDAQDD
jgi:hypothetical protein